MFCGKCGTQNADDASVCVNCGAELKKKEKPKKTISPVSNNSKIGKIAVVVAALILAFLLFGGRSYKSVANKYIDAIFDNDAKAIINLAPSKVAKYLKQEDEYDDVIESGNRELNIINNLYSLYFDDGKYKVSHKITYKEDIKDGSLDYIKNNYKELGVNVKAAKDIEVEVTLKSKDEEKTDTYYFTVIKVGRSWYLDVTSINIF